MKTGYRKALIVALIALLAGACATQVAPGRWEADLSGGGWKLWLDKDAKWIDDELFLPPVDVSNLPVNPPTCGWDDLDNMNRIDAAVPGTVEEYTWNSRGNFVGTAGDYHGVSWWSRTFTLDSAQSGRRIVIAIESANLRAEVYVNQQLVGYDIVGNTAFECDATSAVTFGGENRIDIRITDAGGNFSWPAHTVFTWGKYTIPIVRGFGGVTGKVFVRALDPVTVDDIYVQNKKQIKEVEVFVTLKNTSGSAQDGTLSLAIHKYGDPKDVLFEKTVEATVPSTGFETSIYVEAPNAEVWGLLDPNLYTALVTFESADKSITDSAGQRFGFRWFDIGEKNGDQRFYLNGKRVFMMAAVNRGYWPKNGIFPTEEYAKKDVETAIRMGYNAIAYHNAIGHQLLCKYADEYGLLATGESAAYRINGSGGRPVDDEFTRTLRREKLFRFVKRDRSTPSLIAYMLKNEDGNPPDDDDFANMKKVLEMDPTRTLLYTGDCDRARRQYADVEKNPLKLFYKPNDDTEYYYGWFDMHHWNRSPGYQDFYYENPENYWRLNKVDSDPTTHVPADEIIFYGEEGAFGTMLTLGKIRDEINLSGSSTGWREEELLNWYEAYDTFLDDADYRKSYPSVDDLTISLGMNMHYYHGRNVENCRISNIIDAYNLNGWASAATHTDMVDAYRNPTGPDNILAYYNQPLYVAVKLRDKVMPIGYEPVADIFIVNEVDLNGAKKLELELVDPQGSTVFENTYDVNLLGGEEYGQLLVEGIQLPAIPLQGYFSLNARIVGDNGIECTGQDKLFAVDCTKGPGLKGNGAVIDNTGSVNAVLSAARGITLPEFTADTTQIDFIVVGGHESSEIRRLSNSIMELVINGTTLVVLANADAWAGQLSSCVEYRNSYSWGSSGRLFMGDSPLLTGLPKAQSMNWEYQVFYRGRVTGIDINHKGNDTVVALGAQNRSDIITAVAAIPLGKGTVILSTLDMLPNLEADIPQASMAKRLFLNFLEYSGK